MKTLLLICHLMLFPFLIGVANATHLLDSLRNDYLTVVKSKEICFKWIDATQALKQKDAVYQAYLGYFQTVRASHITNPISKFKTFNEGKENVEKAVQLDGDNVEIRFLRLSIQKNAPNFLNYNKHINTDTQFIKKHLNLITSKTLLDNIQLLLKQ